MYYFETSSNSEQKHYELLVVGNGFDLNIGLKTKVIKLNSESFLKVLQ